ncbi:MAG: c-type cytochrome [Myxococcota bacterium]
MSGEVLARGERGYRTVCASCHGVEGDGQGRLGMRQVPAPRSFASGVIKFASVPAGELWTDHDVLRVLHEGLQGTQMLAFKLPDEELRAIVQHLKTFSPRFRTEAPGEPVEISPDPWREGDVEARAVGNQLYASLGCASCHESGRSTPTIWNGAIDAPKLGGYRPKAGAAPERLYQTLAAGVGGVEGKDGLAKTHGAREIWALVHYLRAVLDTAG